MTLLIESLDLTLSNKTIVKNVDLNVKPGEVVGLLGPNGAGKSTLLFTLAGIINSDQGKVLFNGEDITNQKTSNLVEKGLALVPENRLIFPHLTVQENLLAGAYARLAKEREKVEEDISAMYSRFPVLKERSSQLGGTMSGGEQQMLAIARGMMGLPKLLMVDEPFLGLSPMVMKDLIKIFKNIVSEGISILFVEQNVRLALSMADRGYVLESGRLVIDGKSEDLIDNEKVTKVFLGN